MALQSSERSTTDPAHPSNPNSDHTTVNGEKPKDAFTVITDVDFLPTLDSAPATQRFKSHFLLFALLTGAVFGAWFFGFELFQFGETRDTEIPFELAEPQAQSWLQVGAFLGLVIVALGVLVSSTGVLAIDWWELVLGYWVSFMVSFPS